MMNITLKRQSSTFAYKALSAFIAFTFICGSIIPPQHAYSQTIPASLAGGLNLPTPGTMVPLSPAFAPALVKGIKIFADNPLRFDFIVDPGDSGLEGESLKAESSKLIKYFLASLTVPEEEMWVNLSPYEQDRIIPEGFGKTEMGRDLLAQDYMLKQITASLIYPEEGIGKEFWDRVYKKANDVYGTSEIPVNTFNKVWIVPEKAIVYENGDTVFVAESHLKVMLDSDYQAMKEGAEDRVQGAGELNPNPQTLDPTMSEQIIREIIIPELEKEVNQGKNFANLRQIYHAVILAAWFKGNLKESFLGKTYMDQNKVEGVNVADEAVNERIYQQYLEAFKLGVYDFIKEEYDPKAKEMIPRKYFSGGAVLGPGKVLGKQRTAQGVDLGDGSIVAGVNLMPQRTLASSPVRRVDVSEERNIERVPVTSDGYTVDPFVTSVVQPTRLITREERIKRIEAAGLNPFKLEARDILIDLLTDSGTGAESQEQRAARELADYSGTGNQSFMRLQKTVKKILGFNRVIPAHQGRGAEQILNGVLLRPGQKALGNRFFDTTTAHVELVGGQTEDYPIEESLDTARHHDFKGNVDLEKLRDRLRKKKDDVGYLLVTITDNTGGGQPVSVANIKGMRQIADEFDLPLSLFADIARFAENALFIKQREEGYKDKSIKDITKEMMVNFDGVQMSSKKDGIVPIGGFLALRDDGALYQKLKKAGDLIEGKAMAGADMESLAQGLTESVDENYLRYRLGQARYLGEQLKKAGVPIVEPVGGHAVFIDAKKFFDGRIPPEQFPAQALGVEMYIAGGIRPVEIGTLLAGRYPPGHSKAGQNKIADLELLRLTNPRRVYSKRQLDYIAEVAERVYSRREHILGLRLTYEPLQLRHFNARFEWVGGVPWTERFKGKNLWLMMEAHLHWSHLRIRL